MAMQAAREAGDEVWRAWHDEAEPIRVGVSACLLEKWRAARQAHKRDRYLTDVLDANVIWVPVCPEIEAGMGIPRPEVERGSGQWRRLASSCGAAAD
ncbi:MAG: 2-thiouracil desulfurase family protein [Myxococcota bacterium]